MKIINLKAENVKRLQAVEITPEGNMIAIGGKNEAGKTSVLDSIAYALSGKNSFDKIPIRKGEQKAEIICELDDIIVKRVITEKGTQLHVMNRDGAKYPSPQKMLDELTSNLTYDPLEFSRMKDRDQLETLKELVGVDFEQEDKIRDSLYEQRTHTNRTIKDMKGQLSGIEYDDSLHDELISVDELMQELEQKESVNRENESERIKLSDLKSEHNIAIELIESLESELKEANKNFKSIEKTLKKQAEIVESIKDEDVEATRENIRNAEDVNDSIRKNHKYKELEQEIKNKESYSSKLSDDIKSIDSEKEEIMAKAKFPIKGLGFNSAGVTYNDIPFSQLSGAQKLRVSLAMGMAMNPKLKVLLIRDGSLLDESNLKIISKMAEKNESQVWIERVGEGKECQIIIEDGMIKETRSKE
jgi:DNA repair exonuclease SbcCD ATPase subunit